MVHAWCMVGARMVHAWCTHGARMVHAWSRLSRMRRGHNQKDDQCREFGEEKERGRVDDTPCKRQAPPKGIFVMFFFSRRAELPREDEIRWAV